MEELTIETPDTESAGDGMDTLPESSDPDTEAVLPESEEYPDENDGEDVDLFEDAESDADEDTEFYEDEESDTSSSEETGNNEAYPEKPESPASGPETVSGNSADYPYGSSEDASTHAAYESGSTDSLLLVETMEKQNDILCAGFMSTLFILGIILGVLVIHGFRLRRV